VNTVVTELVCNTNGRKFHRGLASVRLETRTPQSQCHICRAQAAVAGPGRRPPGGSRRSLPGRLGCTAVCSHCDGPCHRPCHGGWGRWAGLLRKLSCVRVTVGGRPPGRPGARGHDGSTQPASEPQRVTVAAAAAACGGHGGLILGATRASESARAGPEIRSRGPFRPGPGAATGPTASGTPVSRPHDESRARAVGPAGQGRDRGHAFNFKLS
jgi:hypothetical protein